MRNFKKIVFVSIFFLFILIIFKNWFKLGIISSRDWPFYFNDQIKSFTIFPNLWHPLFNSFGGNIGFSLSLNTYFTSTAYILAKNLNFTWPIIERIIWFWPFILVSLISSCCLAKSMMSKNIFLFLTPLIFLLNSYILLVVGGGQMGIAMSYAMAPLTLAFFNKLINKINFELRLSLITGILVSLQLMFDSRILYITLVGVVILFFVKEMQKNNSRALLKKAFIVLLTPCLVSGFIHAFWLIPFLVVHRNPLDQLGNAFTTNAAVQFFSFAKFENTISLLHPNWPENIFGKVYFMRSEFLLLPLLAFGSMLFIKKLKNSQERIVIIYFVLLGLIGAFLAKGSNEPFGGIYLWLFNHFPGFMMFRDSTKWYLLVAISYSMLIPFTVYRLFLLIKVKTEKLKFKSILLNFANLFTVLVLGCMLFLISPVLLGTLGGTFKTTFIPSDYTKLEAFLYSKNDFSRTLWVPQRQSFSFYSNKHPAISAEDLFSDPNIVNLIKKMDHSKVLLQNAGIKYIIVPYDSENQIFLNDRKYDEKLYLRTISGIGEISWLKRIAGFGKIKVFEVPNPKDHFWLTGKGDVTYRIISPVEFKIVLKNVSKGDLLVFSEGFDEYWITSGTNMVISSKKFDSFFNSFILPKDGNYELKTYYEPQKWVNLGLIVSVITLVSILIFLGFGYVTKK